MKANEVEFALLLCIVNLGFCKWALPMITSFPDVSISGTCLLRKSDILEVDTSSCSPID